MKIIVYTDNYPSSSAPLVGTFVYKFVQSAIKGGCNVKVIAPGIYNFNIFKRIRRQFYGNESAIVLRPKVWSFSNKWICGFNTFHIYRRSKVKSLSNILALETKFDALYCHFLSNALIAAEANLDNDIPIIAAVGEYRNIDVIKSFYKNNLYDLFLNRINGFIAVSQEIKTKLLSIGVNEKKIIVLPNGTDRDVFKPLDKKLCRKKFNIPNDKKLILFIGRFIYNKGPLRLLNAIKLLNDSNIQVCFIGTGPEGNLLVDNNIKMKRVLPYYQIPEIMSAADLFVLPTLHEGSSNVIVEAMACGLPIISSNIPEIQSQCNNEFSILVDPTSVEEISKAINSIIYSEEKLKAMGINALNHSFNFDLDNRTGKVIDFISTLK